MHKIIITDSKEAKKSTKKLVRLSKNHPLYIFVCLYWWLRYISWWKYIPLSLWTSFKTYIIYFWTPCSLVCATVFKIWRSSVAINQWYQQGQVLISLTYFRVRGGGDHGQTDERKISHLNCCNVLILTSMQNYWVRWRPEFDFKFLP